MISDWLSGASLSFGVCAVEAALKFKFEQKLFCRGRAAELRRSLSTSRFASLGYFFTHKARIELVTLRFVSTPQVVTNCPKWTHLLR